MQILDRNSLRGLSKVRLVGSNENEIVSPLVALERAEQRGMDFSPCQHGCGATCCSNPGF